MDEYRREPAQKVEPFNTCGDPLKNQVSGSGLNGSGDGSRRSVISQYTRENKK